VKKHIDVLFHQPVNRRNGDARGAAAARARRYHEASGFQDVLPMPATRPGLQSIAGHAAAPDPRT
jgi:hypothetical protein